MNSPHSARLETPRLHHDSEGRPPHGMGNFARVRTDIRQFSTTTYNIIPRDD